MAIDAVDEAHAYRPPAQGAITDRRARATRLAGRFREQRRSLGIYGSDASRVRELGLEHPEWNKPLHPALPYRASEVVWAARHEAARSVQDVLARRTRALFLDARASIEAAPMVATLLAAELGRDANWMQQQVRNSAPGIALFADSMTEGSANR